MMRAEEEVDSRVSLRQLMLCIAANTRRGANQRALGPRAAWQCPLRRGEGMMVDMGDRVTPVLHLGSGA